MPADTVAVRLVEWNVAMSLQRKTHLLAALQPTLAILPESACLDRTRSALATIGATSAEWVGANPNKGLLAAAFGGWRLQIDASYDPGFQWVMPLHLTGPGVVRVLAVWDMNHRGSGHDSARRLGACRASLEHYADFLSGPSDLTVISGDFNNSVYWDKPSKVAKFGDFMDQLEAKGFVSAYHSHHGSLRGSELHPTLWWLKNTATTYHIDYTFVSLPETIERVTMGEHADWIAHSDHSPMIVDLRVQLGRNEESQSHVSASVADCHEMSCSSDTLSTKHMSMKSAKETTRRSGTMRFPIPSGALPDMPCGVNGENFVHSLRPAYFTAEWRRGALAEVRIWGPRVLNDGTTGVRMLDHRWHDVKGSGPVTLGAMPTVVATQIKVHAAENGLSIPAE